MAQTNKNIADLSYDEICKLENHIKYNRLVAHLLQMQVLPDFVQDFEFFYMLIPEPVHWNLYDDITLRFKFQLLRTGVTKEHSIKKHWSLFRLELKEEFKVNPSDSET
jgi:hypothetical protein